MRKYLVGGNWKCNGTIDFATKFPTDVLRAMKFDSSKFEVVVAPSTIHLLSVQRALTGSHVQLSA